MLVSKVEVIHEKDPERRPGVRVVEKGEEVQQREEAQGGGRHQAFQGIASL